MLSPMVVLINAEPKLFLTDRTLKIIQLMFSFYLVPFSGVGGCETQEADGSSLWQKNMTFELVLQSYDISLEALFVSAIIFSKK